MIVRFQDGDWELQAVNDAVFVVRDATENKSGGIFIPDAAQKKPHTGDIKTVGKLVQDTKISSDKKAVFNQNSGQPIQVGETEFTVVRASDIIGVLSKKA